MLKNLLLSFMLVIFGSSAFAQDLEALVAQLPQGSYADRAEVVEAISQSGDDRALGILQALSGGSLRLHKAAQRVVDLREIGGEDIAFDILTGAEIGAVGRRDAKKIKVNNGLRRVISAAIGAMSLQNPDPKIRIEAANAVFNSGDPAQIDALDAAMSAESDGDVATALAEARAVAVLNSDSEENAKLAAIATLRASGDRDAQAVLSRLADDPALGAAATAAMA